MSTSARILIVEDDPAMAKYISHKVKSLGYTVMGMAANEAMAIRLAPAIPTGFNSHGYSVGK